MKWIDKKKLQSLLEAVRDFEVKWFSRLFRNLGIRIKMAVTTGFIALFVITMLLVTVFSGGKDATRDSFYAHATSLNELRKRKVERYFDLVRNQLITLSESRMTIEASESFSDAFNSEFSADNLDEKRRSLESFYKEKFLSKYGELAENKIDISEIIPIDENTIYFQQKFLSSNNIQDTQSGKEKSWGNLHKLYHPSFQEYKDRLGLKNIYLIDPNTGYIVYSVNKEIDFATNLKSGKFAYSELAQTFNETSLSSNTDFVKITDFKAYIPSYSSPVMFMASPIISGTEVVGVLAFQITTKKLDDVINDHDKMRGSFNMINWETYVVGSDFKVKSTPQSFTEKPKEYFETLTRNNIDPGIIESIRRTGSPAQNQTIKNPSIAAGLGGETGNYNDLNYAGFEVYGAYTPLKIEGLNWALVSERNPVDIEENMKGMLMALIYVAIIVFLIAFGISLLIGNIIIKPLLQLCKDLEPIASGDLTVDVRVRSKDEIGQAALALKKLIEKLRMVIGSVIDAADNISLASKEMNTSSMRMSEGANVQASSAEEISSSMEEMSANIQQNSDNAKETEKIALTAAQEIRTGNDSVHRTLFSMESIIDKITIIDEIAKQTNLLALTAAVEAARAGEYGKGFAMGAADLRRLTDIGQKAATEIDEVSGSSLISAKNSGKLLEKIVPNIEKTSQLVQEISMASMEQNSGADQITGAIQQLNKVIQQNAATAEEMAASSEELSSQADHLKDLVSFFKTGNLKKNTTTSRIYTKEKKIDFNKYENVKSNVTVKGIDLNLGKAEQNDEMDDEFEKF